MQKMVGSYEPEDDIALVPYDEAAPPRGEPTPGLYGAV
jgi:hypothetical protein